MRENVWMNEGSYRYEVNYTTGEATGRVILIEDERDCGCYDIRDDCPGHIETVICFTHALSWPEQKERPSIGSSLSA